MIGQTLGPYKIIEQIGAGGMATVYKAYHAAMDRFVAIKVLPPNMAQDPQFTTRFAQEARTIAKLEHPFILPVYDSGNEKGTAYIVMRYMEAGTLADLLNKGRPELRYSVRLIQRIAEALDYANSQGIVHRDIKPNNILIDKNGQPYLTDFGIAKILESAANLTGSGIIGTPSYMSPEQGQGMPVDARSDIYSLGVVLYEMVTSRLPFESTTPMGVMLKHIQEPLPSPRLIAPDVPPAVEAVIAKAMEKNREARYHTAGEMARALESAITGQVVKASTAARREPSATVAVSERTVPARGEAGGRGKPPTRPPTRAARASDTTPEKEEKRNSPNWLLLLGCGGLGLLAVVALAIAAVFAVPGLWPTTDPNLANQAATQTFAAAYDSAVQTAQALAGNNTTPLPPDATTPAPGVVTDTPTPTLQAATDTPTDGPTNTPGITGCNENAKYVADVTIPDNTQLAPNTAFTKTWRIENTGTCTWDSTYTLRFVGGVQMGGPGSINFPASVSPGGQMDISVNLVSPASPGNYTGQWRLFTKDGNAFGINGQPLTVVIVVPATPTPTFTPTVTLTPPPALGSSANDFAGNWFNDDVTTGGVTQLFINAVNGSQVNVHAWGRCHPTDCDWGTGSGSVSNFSITVNNFPSAPGKTLVLSLSSANSLQAVNGSSHYSFHVGPVANDWVGTWTNANASTNNITKIIITVAGNQLSIHPFGKCSPSDCDWGTKNFNYANPLNTGSDFPHNLIITFNRANEMTVKDTTVNITDGFRR